MREHFCGQHEGQAPFDRLRVTREGFWRHRGFGRHGMGGHGFGGHGFAGFGGGWRMRRGFVRVAVLKLLAEGPRHGYELLQLFKERGWGAPGPGSIYPVLVALAEHGFVTAEESDGKRVYTITDDGRAFLHEHEERFADAFEGAAESDERDTMRASMERLMQAAMQAANSPNAEIADRARAILDQARKEIYTLLAHE